MNGARPVGVAVVGAGSAGRQHVAALALCPGAELVAVCDQDPGALAALAAATGQGGAAPARSTTSLEELLADDAVDVVSIATPPGNHAALAATALSAGRAVVLEKPPVLCLAELDDLLARSEAPGLPVGVMLQHRFRIPGAARAHDWSASTVASVEVVRYRPDEHYRRGAWRTDPRESGGGMVAHLGVHYLDLACQLLGEPVEVDAKVDEGAGPGIDRRVALTARFGSGARMVFVGTTGVDRRSERLALFDGGAELLVTGRSTVHSSTGAVEEPAAPTPVLRASVFADVAGALRERRPPAVAGLGSARGVVRILEAVRAAASPGVGS